MCSWCGGLGVASRLARARWALWVERELLESRGGSVAGYLDYYGAVAGLGMYLDDFLALSKAELLVLKLEAMDEM